MPHTYIGEEDGGDDWETSDGPKADPGPIERTHSL
jgi:hypothetical protein